MAVGSQPVGPASATTSEFDVRELLRLLVQQKWIILGVLGLTVGIAVFGTLSLPKVYEATATLEYDPNPPKPLGSEVEDVLGPVSASSYAFKEWYQTQNKIIESRVIAERVVQRLALHRDPDFMNVSADARATWTGSTVEDATKLLLKRMTVKLEKDTRITRIAVESRDPERAALLANSIAEAYLEWVMEHRLGSTVRAVEWLSGQLDDVSKRLEQSEHAVHDFRRANNVLSLSLENQQNGIAQTIESFRAALADAATRRIQVEAQLQQLEEAVRSNPFDVRARLVTDNAVVSGLRQRYHEALIEREALSGRYGPRHPEFLKVQREIDTLVAVALQEISGLIEVLRAELREIQQIERGLERAKQQAQNTGLNLKLQEITYNRLERERANNEKLYSVLLQRTTETNLTKLLRVSPVRLVDTASAPTVPVRPKPLLNIAAGCLLGLLAGLGAAVLRARMDRSVRTPEDVVALGTTVLGLVPSITSDSKLAQYGGPPRSRRMRGRSEQRTLGDKDLIVHASPRSAVAECCRTIRTNLAFMSTDKPLRAIVVTSPGPGEGKTTLAISLSITLAQSGRRVLLIDTDLRRPRVHKSFGLAANTGITSVLAGEDDIENCCKECLVPGLFVLPCGPIPPNPSELLHTAAFNRLLGQLKDCYDILILDSSPVGLVIDAAVIGPQVDGALIVAKSGRTSRDALAHATKQMRDVGSNVLGCVLNHVDLSRQGGYGGYYYARGGYYYSNEDSGGGDGGTGTQAPPASAPVSPRA